MDSLCAHDVTLNNGEKTHYYEGGSKDGIPLIFIHGWPDVAESWKHQLSYFVGQSRYRVIAPDMRGYGDSSAPTDKRSYSLQVLVPELVELADKLHVEKAVWIGHDWGCGVLNALAAHHPELFLGLAVLCVPYRSIEVGLDHIISLVNRDIYPEAEYQFGQWEYMKYYELHYEESVKTCNAYADKISKILYMPHDPSKFGEPAHTSRTLRLGGLFGENPEALPDIPLEATFLDASLHSNLLKSHKKHGFFPATAYYLNHDLNAEYAKSEKNDGVLDFPLLYIDARHDSVCSPSTTPKLKTSQEQFAKKLTYETIESGHWVMLEKAHETNRVLDKWLTAHF